MKKYILFIMFCARTIIAAESSNVKNIAIKIGKRAIARVLIKKVLPSHHLIYKLVGNRQLPPQDAIVFSILFSIRDIAGEELGKKYLPGKHGDKVGRFLVIGLNSAMARYSTGAPLLDIASLMAYNCCLSAFAAELSNMVSDTD